MIKKVTKFIFLILAVLSFHSCISNKMQFGTKTEIRDERDSAKALATINMIKKLNYSEFKPGKFNDGKMELNYRLLSPENTNRTKKHPLILVFHGSGAIGDNNTSQMGVLSKMWLLPENRKKFSTYVLSPQFPVRSSNYHLDERRGVQASESNDYLDFLLKSVDSLANTLNIDRSRIYVVGFSMGGATVMNAISKRPDLFAAAINVSGISQFENINNLTELPIWIVHGTQDTDNFPQSNLKFYEEMKNKGKVLLWEYKDKYHNNILSADLIANLPNWLFKQNK